MCCWCCCCAKDGHNPHHILTHFTSNNVPLMLTSIGTYAYSTCFKAMSPYRRFSNLARCPNPNPVCQILPVEQRSYNIIEHVSIDMNVSISSLVVIKINNLRSGDLVLLGNVLRWFSRSHSFTPARPMSFQPHRRSLSRILHSYHNNTTAVSRACQSSHFWTTLSSPYTPLLPNTPTYNCCPSPTSPQT